jgi:hypothetical protein
MCAGGCAVVVRTLLLWREALFLLTASCSDSSLLYLAVCLDDQEYSYCVNHAIHCFITACGWVSGKRHTSHQFSLLPTLLTREKGVGGSVGTNGACLPDLFLSCIASSEKGLGLGGNAS